MTTDFTLFYKDSYQTEAAFAAANTWDLFISAYNTTDRVRKVFTAAPSADKRWVIHSEYGFVAAEFPVGHTVYSTSVQMREDDYIRGFIDTLPPLVGLRLCIDISGFMRPHLMFLVGMLGARGLTKFDAVYAEPAQYAQLERTMFAQGDVAEVRPVAGFEGLHQPSLVPDDALLIVAAGYEHNLVRHVANAKDNAKKLQLVGFPPLQADFYQENILNTEHAAEAVGGVDDTHPLFAPASDPFVTASVLGRAIQDQRLKGVKNVYLCPLATRPQTLGFALYYLYEGKSEAVSVLYPFAPKYARDAATGLARIWKYQVELP